MDFIVDFILLLIHPFLDKLGFTNESVERDFVFFVTVASTFFSQLVSRIVGASFSVCNQRKNQILNSHDFHHLFYLVTCKSFED